MNMYETADKLRAEYKELFQDNLTFRQLWWVVKMMKAARLYCRGNTAFNNFMSSVFKDVAQFRQVEREGTDGRKYPGLAVKMLRPDGTTAEEVVAGTEEE